MNDVIPAFQTYLKKILFLSNSCIFDSNSILEKADCVQSNSNLLSKAHYILLHRDVIACSYCSVRKIHWTWLTVSAETCYTITSIQSNMTFGTFIQYIIKSVDKKAINIIAATMQEQYPTRDELDDICLMYVSMLIR